MFGLFILLVIAGIVWFVKRSTRSGLSYYDTVNNDDSSESNDEDSISYTPSVPTRTTYKPRISSTSRSGRSISRSSGGFGGGRSGGGGSSSGW